MKEHINTLPLSNEALALLSLEKDAVIIEESAQFVERASIYGGHGFHVDTIIFKFMSKLYKFAAIRYLKNKITFTVPYEVFRKEETYTRNVYSNWVPEDEE